MEYLYYIVYTPIHIHMIFMYTYTHTQLYIYNIYIYIYIYIPIYDFLNKVEVDVIIFNDYNMSNMILFTLMVHHDDYNNNYDMSYEDINNEYILFNNTM